MAKNIFLGYKKLIEKKNILLTETFANRIFLHSSNDEKTKKWNWAMCYLFLVNIKLLCFDISFINPTADMYSIQKELFIKNIFSSRKTKQEKTYLLSLST